jgi:hypothetical protein
MDPQYKSQSDLGRTTSYISFELRLPTSHQCPSVCHSRAKPKVSDGLAQALKIDFQQKIQ